MLKRWTPEDDAKLISLVKSYRYTAREIGEMIQRTESAVRYRLYRLGVKYRPLPYAKRPWTAKDDQLVAKLFANGCSYDEIAKRMDRSAAAIRFRLDRLLRSGLVKGA